MGLADDAVRGLNAPEMPPVCPPFEPEPVPEWQRLAAEFSRDDLYPNLIRRYVEEQILGIRMREDQAAFLLFGVHR